MNIDISLDPKTNSQFQGIIGESFDLIHKIVNQNNPFLKTNHFKSINTYFKTLNAFYTLLKNYDLDEMDLNQRSLLEVQG